MAVLKGGRYAGKRFAAFLVCTAIIFCAYVINNVDTFAALTTSIGLMFGAYVGGQSWTDNTRAQNGHGDS